MYHLVAWYRVWHEIVAICTDVETAKRLAREYTAAHSEYKTLTWDLEHDIIWIAPIKPIPTEAVNGDNAIVQWSVQPFAVDKMFLR